ncbi:hypothetical protein AB1K70_03470 [Bremerella sp. JC770]|uniref:hypothetical protein n=1 Tax=Bremerella sp. JC770 TaxID=3232137 RepID=UPI0034596210
MDERNRDFFATVAYIYLQHGNPADAVAILEVAVDELANDCELLRLLTYGLLRVQRFQDALERSDQLSVLGAKDETHNLMRSRALLGLGREREARQLWRSSRQPSDRAPRQLQAASA